MISKTEKQIQSPVYRFWDAIKFNKIVRSEPRTFLRPNYTTPTLTNNTTLNTPQTFQVQVNFKQANSEQCQILALTKFVSEVSKFGIDATSQIVGGLLSAADSVVNSTVGTVGSTVGSVVKGLGLKERATNQYVGAANYANDME
ncbi:9730_t:CDS:2, partial [Dentiscutata erythropus]